MERVHVHRHVEDLATSIGCCSKPFAAGPARVDGDAAKCMLDDPRVSFAVSTRGRKPGIDRLGLQTGDAAGRAAVKACAQSADRSASG